MREDVWGVVFLMKGLEGEERFGEFVVRRSM